LFGAFGRSTRQGWIRDGSLDFDPAEYGKLGVARIDTCNALHTRC